MKAPQDVLTLVARFREHRDAYLSAEYNEATLRKEFLEPLFRAIGWDVDNTKNYAEAYKEVVHEDALKVSGATKAPDYAFRLGGARKFFVEAKKPSVDVKGDPSPAYQLRRYAWSAKLPLSILTDFHEFAVYDCTKKPSPTDTAATGRILYLTYEDYAERWEEIAGLFSPEAIQKGAFDQFAASAKGKKGTAAVDDAFLGDIEAWRDLLAHNLALRNPELSQRELNDAVQTTIDRIIFLRICEDRGIENYGALQGLLNGTRVYPRLVELFRAADDRYNSGLFHFRAEKDRAGSPDTLTLSLEIDDKVLKEILGSLYYPVSPYEFSVLPADLLGHVYEQFLGKVIRLTPGHRAVVEEKPEVKKAGGVYYTPTYIVDYIVKNTVGKLLEGKSPKEVATLRILDPACGSGSFLLGAYQCLLDWHESWYAANDPEKWARGRSPKLFRGPKGDWRLTTAERKRILLDHLFGVDIDAQAVEVTKLSLLLKVLEGENAETLGKTIKLLHERALPDLGRNIQCGNSLIGTDFYDDHPLETLSEEERYRINAFDWEIAFPDIMKQGGFDVVIGNPPYGADYSAAEKGYFQAKYTYRKGKPETYLFFLERGISVLRVNGALGYITPNAWLTNYYGAQLRRLVLSSTTLSCLVDLEPARVFSAAVVDTAITILTKARPRGGSRPTHVFRGTRDFQIQEAFEASQEAWQSHPQAVINLQASPADLLVLGRLEESGRTLGSVVEYSQGVIPYETRAGGDANPHISSERRGPDWMPLIERASQVRRYAVSQPEAFIHYGPWLGRAREARFFSEPKILFHRLRKKLPRQLVGALDTTGAVNRHALSNLILRSGQPPDALHGVLGLFNSSVTNWWFVKRYGLLMEVGGFKTATIPLPSTWGESQSQLIAPVKRMILLHKQLSVADTDHERAVLQRQIDATDRKIDQLIYELYGLTDEEIQIVEEAARAT